MIESNKRPNKAYHVGPFIACEIFTARWYLPQLDIVTFPTNGKDFIDRDFNLRIKSRMPLTCRLMTYKIQRL